MFPASSKILARASAGARTRICKRADECLDALGFGDRHIWRRTADGCATAGDRRLLPSELPACCGCRPGRDGRRRRHTLRRPMLRLAAPGFAAILRKRAFWGAASGHFCANYLVYFLMSWLPYYLVHERHLSMSAMSVAAGALWVVDSLSSVATGTITDMCIRRGASPTIARKWAMAVGFTLAAVSLVGCAFAGEHTYLACLIACAVGSGTANAGTFAFAQTLAGPRRRREMGGVAERNRQHGRGDRAGTHRIPCRLDRSLRRRRSRLQLSSRWAERLRGVSASTNWSELISGVRMSD